MELQIAGANYFAAFNPEAVGNSSESAFSTSRLLMIAPPFERVHYVQPCARGRGQILFAAINPENCREFIRKCIFPAGQQYQQHHWCASNEINWKERTGNEMQATVPESGLIAPEMLLGVAVLLYCNVQLHILAIAVGK